jgi:hypothetical protein
MNKTRKRAIQKHRAKAIKFEVRRKAGGDAGANRAKASAGPATSARSTRQTRRQESTDDTGSE